ncbi:MAG: glutamate--tRNA ligase [Rhizobiales bacterium]|nr:glutamate--tRNA ligase [Hyphomicrobiales bacterium]
MSKQVVTRFAPSPTGYLHIGGARTALFNWLYAKRHGGRMLLRIEDTDRARSTDEAVAAILDGLSWLGLDWDGEPISQFSRIARHQEVAEELLARGKAYRCYASPEELDAMRETARAEGRPPIYDGRWRDRDPAEAPPGVAPVIRIKTEQHGETIVHDKVQGDVRFANKDIDDFIILRSDGVPTYMMAVVVDDHDMNVTHVIRGDDHLTNAARQIAIFKAMDWEIPVFAHIPLIHGPDGAKLSKRHGALGAEAYRALGYLPVALKNYLLRLGWSKGDEEIISPENMIDWFGFEGMGRAAARFDFAKLEALNGHYIRHMPDADLIAAIDRMLPEMAGGPEIIALLDATRRAQLLKAMPGLKERAKTLVELIENASFIYRNRPLALDDKARELLTPDARAQLARLADQLTKLAVWDPDALDVAVRAFAEAEGLKLGKIAQPLRAALTGTTTSPGIFDVLDVLGRQESIARICDQKD